MSLRRKRLLLLAGSILLPLLAAEAWLRNRVQADVRNLSVTLAHQASANPKLVHEHRPSLRTTWPDSDAPVAINAAGFRVLDLLDSMRAGGSMDRLRGSPDDVIHLNDTGREIAAAASRAYLASNATSLGLG